MTSDPENPTRRRTPVDDLRRIRDARTLKALAHPVRVALQEILSVDGPLTATEAAERIGETPTTCSFHLRQLAKYGFVEEAGGGKGRSRPWRARDQGLDISSDLEDPEAAIAANTLARLWRENQLRRLDRWREVRSSYPREWREAAGHSETVMWMTAEELRALNEELIGLLMNRFRERRNDPSARPAGALPVETLLFNYPVGPPQGGGG
ncbi:MAG TPA: helix-turn-helix domain-containing protein [Solirubrobacteraceae bacterium]|nr:helix-turn-helix domain-containing protein [Solirubrobacteraceae bacterium]